MSKPPQDKSDINSDAPMHSLPGQEIDALRRHICQILGFDIALIDIVRGDSIDNLFTFFAEDPGDNFSIDDLHDCNNRALSVSDNELSQEVRRTFAPYTGTVSAFSGSGMDERPLPYIIVPISDGQGDASQMVKGLIRVISFDPDKVIEHKEISGVRMIGQHLATRIPCLASSNATAHTVPKRPPLEPEKTEPIVVAHSNRAIRRRLSRCLSNDYNILEAESSKKIPGMLQDNGIGLLLLDSALTDETGQSLCKSLKASGSQWQHLPVILVTGEADQEARIEGLNAGADDCISDNCLDAELLARVRSCLRLRKTERELAMQLQLLEDYAQRLEYATEVEQLASAKISTERSQIDAKNQELKLSYREIEILRNQDLRLRRISDCIRKSFHIEENIGEVLESLSGWLELDSCFVVLTEECEDHDAIRREYATYEGYRISDESQNHDLEILEIFKNLPRQELLLINDVKRDKRIKPFKEVLSNYHLYSAFYVPITYQEKLLGILGGHKCEAQAQWSQHYETFFEQIADQLAIGVTNARLYKRVERQATTDGLTNLFNHRTGQEKLSEQFRLTERYQRHLSVVMMDVDHFKSINDTYGHPVGDTVLKAVARIIRRDCRDVDIPVRYGGEEFLLVLPEINQEGAVIVAERLRKALQREVISHDDVQLSVTASFGVASYPEDAEVQQQLLEMADKALYMSKRLGRNQVHTASDLIFQDLEKQKQDAEAPAAESASAGAPDAVSSESDADKEALVPEVVEMVKAMAGALYAKSEYNKIHHLETARFSEMVAKVLGLSQRQVEQIRVAGLLHDVGLLSVPEDIINKPGQVTAEELRVLMQHPLLGAQMFRPIHALKEICDILEHHHECWDGTGYPSGLKGEQIPLAARIIAIVDAYHAMVSDRPYRPAMSQEKAKRVLRNGAGTQFDPFLVDIFLAVLSESSDVPPVMPSPNNQMA